MDTVEDLYRHVREKFPKITASADRFHEKRWGEGPDAGDEYVWFEALANALNAEMCHEVHYSVHEPLFNFISGAFSSSPGPVQNCIDVSFVENLFWQVPSAKSALYWAPLPLRLRQLYMDFHHRAP